MIPADITFGMMGGNRLTINRYRYRFAVSLIGTEIEIEPGLEMIHAFR